MQPNQIIALVLAGMAAVDLAIGFGVVAPRVKQEIRQTVLMAISIGSVLMLVLAVAFWFSWIGSTLPE